MRRPFILFLSLLCAVFMVAAPAMAVEADEVATAAANDGFYVERGASISESQAGALVAELRNMGEGFVLVVLANEPAAGATTFADAVEANLGRGIVLVIAPDSVGLSGNADLFNEAALDEAFEVALNTLGSDLDLARAFVGQLTGNPVVAPTAPVPVPTTVAAPAPTTQQPSTGSGGGGNGFLWLILIVGGALFIWWMVRHAKARATTQPVDDGSLAKARYVIQEQLNDVANDILAMEDEVRVADNSRADRFYQQASRTYNDVSEALPKASHAQGLLDLSNKLDAAIWQLDSAEAVLDDKPLPERPEPKRLEQPTAPQSYDGFTTPDERARSIVVSTSPDPEIVPRWRWADGPSDHGWWRRRQQSWQAIDPATQLGPHRRRGLGGGLGDLFKRKRQPAPRQPRTPTPPSSRSGRGSNPVPGPGRPATPSSSRSQVPKTDRAKGLREGSAAAGKRRKR